MVVESPLSRGVFRGVAGIIGTVAALSALLFLSGAIVESSPFREKLIKVFELDVNDARAAAILAAIGTSYLSINFFSSATAPKDQI